MLLYIALQNGNLRSIDRSRWRHNKNIYGDEKKKKKKSLITNNSKIICHCLKIYTLPSVLEKSSSWNRSSWASLPSASKSSSPPTSESYGLALSGVYPRKCR